MKRLKRKSTTDLVKELDAFPKVPESYVEKSAFRGTGEFWHLLFEYYSSCYL